MIRLAGLPHPAERLVFTACGRLVGVSRPQVGPERAVWWDVATGAAVRELAAESLGLSPGGRYLAIRDPHVGVSVFDGAAATPLAVVPVGYGDRDSCSAAVSPAGDRLVTVHGGRVLWHKLPGGGEVLRRPRAGAWAAGYSPGGRWAFAAGRTAVRFWDGHARNALVRVPCAARAALAAVAADDRTAAVGGDRHGSVAVWDLDARRAVAGLVHRTVVTAVAVSPDGARVLTGDTAGTVRVWDAADGREAADFDFGLGMVTSVAVAPDGLTAAAAGAAPGNPVVVWDV